MSFMTSCLPANEKYVAEYGDKASIPMKPRKNLVVVTCMDPRLHPNAFLGLDEGAAVILRNAGGNAKDALRSILVSQHLGNGPNEIAIIHHTDCGMTRFTTPQVRARLREQHPHAHAEADKVEMLEFSDVDASIREDVQWLKAHPLLHAESEVRGYMYEVETGKVREVV